MKLAIGLLVIFMVLHCSYAPPVTTPKPSTNGQDSPEKDNLSEYMEYHRYLKEVVEALESDNAFRDKLEKANDADIRTGKIADQLDFVNHNVRTQLDEIKRREMERLRHLATREFELTNNLDTESLKVSSAHLDHQNPHTFEIEDLKRLIKKTTDDLAEADKKRREEFKEYEMQKEFEKHQREQGMTEQEKKEYEANLKEEEKLHKQHPKVHNPGSKQQLEEVWEKQDHMEKQEFNPKVFFMMHDVDGNGVWDADEVKALFIKELDKMYNSNGNHTDLRERQEEMERMREYVFQSSDTNRDGLIDYNEFLMQTKKNDFQTDPEWKGINENEIYTHQEYEAYERRRLEELKYLQERGIVDEHGQPIHGGPQYHPQQYHNQPPYQPIPPQYQGQYYQQHPNEIPAQYAQHPGQHPSNQAQMHQGYQPHGQNGYAPQGQGQIPQGHGQIPQGHAQQQANIPPHNVQQGYVQQASINGQQEPNHAQHESNNGKQVPNHAQQVTNHGQQVPNHGQQVPNHGQQAPNHGQQAPNHGQQAPQQGQIPPQHGQIPAQ